MLLSIAIPVLKTQYLEETLTALAAQASDDVALILVDNTEGDEVEPLARKIWTGKMQYIRNHEKAGFQDSMNQCIAAMNTPWGLLHCDDDIMPPSSIPTLLGSIQYAEPSTSAFVYEVDLIDEQSKKYGRLKTSPHEWKSSSGMNWLMHYFRHERPVIIGNCLFRVEAFRQTAGFRSTKLGFWMDAFHIFELGTQGLIQHIDLPLIQWRQNPHQSSSTFSLDDIALDLKCFEQALLPAIQKLPNSQLLPWGQQRCLIAAALYIHQVRHILHNNENKTSLEVLNNVESQRNHLAGQ